MSDWIWINGETLPASQARLSVEDRGFQFADGVYEVIRFYGGRLFRLDDHLRRLLASAEGIRVRLPLAPDDLANAITRFVERAGLTDGMVYLQLTRGVAPRNHAFPEDAQPTLLFYLRPLAPLAPAASIGVKLVNVEDERWKRCWVKSIALLPNVLAKQAAIDAQADEAVFVEGQGDRAVVTECCASNLFVVRQGAVYTHPVGPKVLPGITRAVLFDIAREIGIPLLEAPVGLSQAMSADEAFITSTTREVQFVRQWDTRTFGASAGPVTRRLAEALFAKIVAECGVAAPPPRVVDSQPVLSV